MGFEFKLPDIGEGVVEGEIVKWLVSPGDAVDVDQALVEVMTDKATVVIPSPRAGTVQETRGAEGEVVEVGQVIVVIDAEGRGASAEAPSAPAVDLSTPPAAPATPAAPPPSGGSVLAAPATRRLARELGVPLGSVSGSGPAGRVTSDDVRKAAAGPAAPAAPTPLPTPVAAVSGGFNLDGEDEVIPVRGVRGRIWDSMTRSKFTAPHFTFVEEVDMSELDAYRARLNGLVAEGESKLTFLPFLIKAICVALDDFPHLNGRVNDAERSFVRRAAKHIGIAVASERGLTVPVVRHAQRRSLQSLAAEVKRLGEAVRTGTVAAHELGGSTFTITSLGKEGGLFATPILNYPEVAIMGVHRLQKRPVVTADDQIVVRKMMNLSLSCDHRWVDGHVAAQFCYRVIGLLERPDRLVLEMG